MVAWLFMKVYGVTTHTVWFLIDQEVSTMGKTICTRCVTGEDAVVVVHSHYGEIPSFPSRSAHVCLLQLNSSSFSCASLLLARRDPLDRSLEQNIGFDALS